jgi:hypothetical protein
MIKADRVRPPYRCPHLVKNMLQSLYASAGRVFDCVVLCLILQSICLLSCHAERANVILVCPPVFKTAIQPWIAQRESEGLSITTLQPPAEAKQLRRAIKAACTLETRYIMLVGDAPVIGKPSDPSRQTPILYARTTVTGKWGSPPTLSTDMFYGDFDDDGIPDAAVGRLPVDHPVQLETWISRILARESSKDFGPWRSRLQLVGGIGGFGMIADTAIESVTRTIITSMVPNETRAHISYASPGHPFCPDQDSFTDAIVENYSRGARFWIYAGHGQITELDRVAPSLGGKAVLDRESVKRLVTPANTSPIAVMLACFTGACDAPEDSIAERMVLSEGGPIAVFAGSRITMPYGNTTTAVGLIKGVFRQKLPRLGDAWRCALNEMHRETTDPNATGRIMIDALATLISPSGTKLPDERREHMLLYNLLGDPTLRLHHPRPLQISRTNDDPTPARFQIKVVSPISGEMSISVERPLTRTATGDPNNTVIVKGQASLRANQPLEVDFTLPPGLKGLVVVRGTVTGDGDWASGATKTILD